MNTGWRPGNENMMNYHEACYISGTSYLPISTLQGVSEAYPKLRILLNFLLTLRTLTSREKEYRYKQTKETQSTCNQPQGYSEEHKSSHGQQHQASRTLPARDRTFHLMGAQCFHLPGTAVSSWCSQHHQPNLAPTFQRFGFDLCFWICLHIVTPNDISNGNGWENLLIELKSLYSLPITKSLHLAKWDC